MHEMCFFNGGGGEPFSLSIYLGRHNVIYVIEWTGSSPSISAYFKCWKVQTQD